ncbi:hypothetical protein O7635_11175 [Asanoa sp. WMMD1127]|uniref:hypothetical protein n=1 Tax=Asanoa sp. WMMD1127 TaxID=3016107 RepID=UPI00241723CB|nr:hypothetical protein [Asanoa sp. WMMD1127]MDG4822410.1 hypothetical protein [Asanoa sp. WMMD1127]
MANVEEVKLNVAASVDETQRALQTLRGVADSFDEALTRLRLTAVGALHPSIMDAIAQLEQARSRLDEAQSLAANAISSADTFRSMV